MKQKLSQLTKKVPLKLSNRGFSLVEILLASALFALVSFGLISTFLYAQNATAYATNRLRAIQYAESGLEAVRDLRNADFDNLVDGTYGITTSSGSWAFSGSSDSFDLMTREITISTISTDIKHISSSVTWGGIYGRTGLVNLGTRLTNWRQLGCVDQSASFVVDYSNYAYANGNTNLVDITISNTDQNCPVEITDIVMTWDGASNLEEIEINGGNVWLGAVSTGQNADIVDTTIFSTDGDVSSTYIFGGNVKNKVKTITYYLGDGTTKVIDLNVAPGACTNQSTYLSVDTSNAKLTNRTKRLKNITVSNTNNSCYISIAEITMLWTKSRSKLRKIKLNGSNVWSGSIKSGVVADIVDTQINNSDGNMSSEYRFSRRMSGDTFTITYTMTDGTTKQITGISP